jgi:hypothetical protein
MCTSTIFGNPAGLARYIIGEWFQHSNHFPQCETGYFKGTISRNFPDAIGPTNPVCHQQAQRGCRGYKDQSSRRVMDQVLGVMRVPERKLLCSSRVCSIWTSTFNEKERKTTTMWNLACDMLIMGVQFSFWSRVTYYVEFLTEVLFY